MRLYILRPGFSRRPVRNTLIGVGVLGVIAIAAVGALLGLVLLAAGALVHFSLRALRGIAVPTVRAAQGGPAVIDGEYTVVRGPQRMIGSR